ncbi:MAG: hypothetical protein AAF216_05785 [Pseudomonadota bacterium]
MRKWLVILILLLLALGAIAFWLADKGQTAKPEPGEVRIEVEDVF